MSFDSTHLEDQTGRDKFARRLAGWGLAIAALTALWVLGSLVVSWLNRSDYRLLAGLDHHPSLNVKATLNQKNKDIWVENHGEAVATDVEILLSVFSYNPESDEVVSYVGKSEEEWSLEELGFDIQNTFVALVREDSIDLPYIFEPDSLQPGKHLIEVSVRYRRAVDDLRYQERAVYVFDHKRRWLAGKDVLSNLELSRLYAPAIHSVLRYPKDKRFVETTDAIESNSGYGAGLQLR